MPKRQKLCLLIDACLTPAVIPALVQRFAERVDVVHLNEVLSPATTDGDVIEWAAREHRLVITANDTDFSRILLSRPDHAGMGCINDQNTRERQIQAITRLVDALLAHIDGEGPTEGRVFVMRRSGRLVVRQLPGHTR